MARPVYELFVCSTMSVSVYVDLNRLYAMSTTSVFCACRSCPRYGAIPARPRCRTQATGADVDDCVGGTLKQTVRWLFRSVDDIRAISHSRHMKPSITDNDTSILESTLEMAIGKINAMYTIVENQEQSPLKWEVKHTYRIPEHLNREISQLHTLSIGVY